LDENFSFLFLNGGGWRRLSRPSSTHYYSLIVSYIWDVISSISNMVCNQLIWWSPTIIPFHPINTLFPCILHSFHVHCPWERENVVTFLSKHNWWQTIGKFYWLWEREFFPKKLCCNGNESVRLSGEKRLRLQSNLWSCLRDQHRTYCGTIEGLRSNVERDLWWTSIRTSPLNIFWMKISKNLFNRLILDEY
jgi:hypothetical protein